ncbi:hypothetical protein ACFE04_010922 [Oxalis oulophora]
MSRPKQSLHISLLLFLILTVVSIRHVVSFSSIKSLPGFPGLLPFNLETGYVGVDEKEDVQLFYYFVESEQNPLEDPLVLWLTGGPGCTALSGLVFEIGPINFNIVEYNGSLPTLTLNPYSWTKVANIIFLDAPVGTGFSYSKTYEASQSGDTIYAKQCYDFLKKWLLSHPKFRTNPLYIAGDSYSGKVVPIIVQEISNSNEDGHEPLNLKGYLLGNPTTDENFDENSKVPFYLRMALISDELYQSARKNCKGEYLKVDESNTLCLNDLDSIEQCINRTNQGHILELKCFSDLLDNADENRRSLQEISTDYIRLPLPKYPLTECRNYNTILCGKWVNDSRVQKALSIREGTVKEWIRCNKSLLYTYDIPSSLNYHLRLNSKGYRALIYSGDHDRLVPYVGTDAWIKSLNLSVVDKWRPWTIEDQIGGYTVEYANNLTFATVKARQTLQIIIEYAVS